MKSLLKLAVLVAVGFVGYKKRGWFVDKIKEVSEGYVCGFLSEMNEHDRIKFFDKATAMAVDKADAKKEFSDEQSDMLSDDSEGFPE